MADLIDQEWVRECMMKTALFHEHQIALAVLRGDKSYTEKTSFGWSVEYDLTTRWWQVLKRRKMMRLALAEIEKEES